MSAHAIEPAGPVHGLSVVADLVDDIERLLERSGIADARAEARDLVAAVDGRNRFWPSVPA